MCSKCNKDKCIKTRQRVLDSALEIFADRGFKDATVSEICKGAGANVASVNYYFSDKRQLYNEVCQYAFSLAIEEFPVDKNINESSDLHDRLRAFVGALLKRIFSDGKANYFPRLMIREMADPTESFDQLFASTIMTQVNVLNGIITGITGDKIDEPFVSKCGDDRLSRLHLCVFSVISQCVYLCFNKAIRQRFFDCDPQHTQQLDSLIDHITTFSMAGIKSTCETK